MGGWMGEGMGESMGACRRRPALSARADGKGWMSQWVDKWMGGWVDATTITTPATKHPNKAQLAFSGAIAAQASCRHSSRWRGKGCSTMIPCTCGLRFRRAMAASSSAKEAVPGSCCGGVGGYGRGVKATNMKGRNKFLVQDRIDRCH